MRTGRTVIVYSPAGTSTQFTVPVAAREKAALATVIAALVPVGSPATARLKTPGGIGAGVGGGGGMVGPAGESPPAQAESRESVQSSAKRVENRRMDQALKAELRTIDNAERTNRARRLVRSSTVRDTTRRDVMIPVLERETVELKEHHHGGFEQPT